MTKLTNEQGSLAPLTIGLALVAVASLLAVSMASTMFIFQKRLTNLAESAALAAAAGEPARDFISQLPNLQFGGLQVEQTTGVDGVTIEVRVCALWQAPLQVLKIFKTTQICSHAAARQEQII